MIRSATTFALGLLLAAPSPAHDEYTYHRTDPTADFDDIFVAVEQMPAGATLRMLDYVEGDQRTLSFDKPFTFIGADPSAGLFDLTLQCAPGTTFVDLRLRGEESEPYFIGGHGDVPAEDLRFESCHIDGWIHTLVTIWGDAHLVDSTLLEGAEDPYDTAVIDGTVQAHRCTVRGTIRGCLIASPECDLQIQNDSDSGSLKHLFGPRFSIDPLIANSHATVAIRGKPWTFGVILLGEGGTSPALMVVPCPLDSNGRWSRTFSVPTGLEGLVVHGVAFAQGFDDPSGEDFSVIR